jgi:hypothetical protein
MLVRQRVCKRACWHAYPYEKSTITTYACAWTLSDLRRVGPPADSTSFSMFGFGVPFPLHSDHSMSEAESQERRFCAPKRLVLSRQDAQKQDPATTREAVQGGQELRPRIPFFCALSCCTRSLRHPRMSLMHRCQSCATRGMCLSPRAGCMSTASPVSSPCGRPTAAQAGANY